MKSTVLICLGILAAIHSNSLVAQTVTFSYDNAGNRISRTLQTEQGGLKSLGRTDTIVIEDDISEELPNAETRIFPNPTDGVMTIEFYPDDEEQYIVSVHNISGYMLLQQQIAPGENVIDISLNPPGTYLITIYSKYKRKKWNVQKL